MSRRSTPRQRLLYSKVPKNNPRLLHTQDCIGTTQIQITLQRDYNAHKTTRTSQAREFKFKYHIYMSALSSLQDGKKCIATVPALIGQQQQAINISTFIQNRHSDTKDQVFQYLLIRNGNAVPYVTY